MPKVRLDDIDTMMEEWEEDQMGDPGVPPHELLEARKAIAEDFNVDVSKVRIWWCGPVNEYCIDINGRWSGYWDWSDFPK